MHLLTELVHAEVTGSNMENGNTGTAAGVVRVAVMMVASFRAGHGNYPGVIAPGTLQVEG